MRVAPVLLAALVLMGCTPWGAESDRLISSRQAQVDRALATNPPLAPPSAVIRQDGSVLGILDRDGAARALPARCQDGITLNSGMPLGLSEVASRLSRILQIPVQVDPRLSEVDERADTVPAHRLPPAGVSGENPPGFPFAPPFQAEPQIGGLPINFSGGCAEVLDRIAGQFDVAWRMRGGVLSFDKYLLRTFSIRASATNSQFTSTMSSGGNGATGGASNAASGSAPSTGNAGGVQSASVSAASDVWTDIEAGLKSLLPRGGKYTMSRAAGTVTVTATPRAMADIAAYLDQMNAILGTTVAVEISAIYIAVDDTDDYGLDLNALYRAGSQKLSLAGLIPTITQAAGTGSIAILSPPQGTNNFATHFAGSQLFLSAVSSVNRLADYRSATVSGRNGVTMPITLTTNQDIVRSLQFAIGLQSGAASTSANTSTINYGFSLEVLPRVIAPGVVSVFISFTANDLTDLRDFPVGNSGNIELATIDTRSLWNESPLKVGQTLVVAGTEQEKVNPQRLGIGSPDNLALGGRYKNEILRTRLILLVTPTIIAAPI